MEASGIINFASFGRDRIAYQRLARLDMRERNRRVAHLDPSAFLARHRECRSCQVPRLREIGTEMRAARIFAPQRGEPNHPADLAQRMQIEPIVDRKSVV